MINQEDFQSFCKDFQSMTGLTIKMFYKDNKNHKYLYEYFVKQPQLKYDFIEDDE